MFLGLDQVYYWRFKCNTHNNYKCIINLNEIKIWNYLQQREEAPSKVGLGLE